MSQTIPTHAENGAGASITPVLFDPSVEHLEDNEAETAQELADILRSISETTYADSGHAIRSVHAKGHGLLRGTLDVLPGLPTALAQGVFASTKSYDAVLRISTTPGDILDDKVSTPRGLALKLIGVDGERLPGSEGDTTQDFLMVNGPAFMAPTAKAFLKNLKLLAATTDKAEGAKKVLSAALRGAERALEAFGSQSGTLKALGGHPLTHPLGETYFTQTPHLYGAHIAKLSLAPVAPDLTALKDAPVDLTGKPYGLRQHIADFFRRHAGVWELRVQLNADLEAMPVEDSSVEWPQDASPYVAVARLTVPVQASWDDLRSPAAEDALSFTPWHGIAAHRPLGSISRVRKLAYETSAVFRSGHNGCPMHEPTAAQHVAL